MYLCQRLDENALAVHRGSGMELLVAFALMEAKGFCTALVRARRRDRIFTSVRSRNLRTTAS